jgi:hypothetical protein
LLKTAALNLQFVGVNFGMMSMLILGIELTSSKQQPKPNLNQTLTQTQTQTQTPTQILTANCVSKI